MKTDSKLQADVLEELAWDPSVDHAHIGVAVNNGVVSLSGHVQSYGAKLNAERATKRVHGVHAIAEEIKVHYPFAKPTDDEIARRILDMFAWDISIPDEQLTVKVEGGFVTLTGQVEWFYQGQGAAALAGRVGGVTGVSNQITVRDSRTVHDVRAGIEAALKRSALVDASRITVRADGGKVTLGGKVHDWHERQAAARAAWAAPGVNFVVDDIAVA
jgi:osmotically-inducible protein OsmY